MPRAFSAVESRRCSFARREEAVAAARDVAAAADSAAVSLLERVRREGFWGERVRPWVRASRAKGSLWRARRARVVR